MPESVQSPPPLIQDPDGTTKPVILAKSDDKTQFDPTKVFAAVGIILTVTLLVVGMMWIALQNLEGRVNDLESELTVVSVKKTTATEAAAKVASQAATQSAETQPE